jgi:hypothetical protein
MTCEEAKASWGEPDSINTTHTKSGISEQWIYDDVNFIYFNNGILDAAQQSINRY